jgi:hypothetical protein
MAEHMRLNLPKPTRSDGGIAQEMTRQGWYLFADQNTEQSQEGDDGRGGGAHVQKSVEDSDRKAHGKADEIDLHDTRSVAASESCDARAHLEKRT